MVLRARHLYANSAEGAGVMRAVVMDGGARGPRAIGALQPIVVPGPPTYILLPNVLVNGKSAHSYGATSAIAWRPAADWPLKLDYSWSHLVAVPEPLELGSNGTRRRRRLAAQSAIPSIFPRSRQPDLSVFERPLRRLPPAPAHRRTTRRWTLRYNGGHSGAWSSRFRAAISSGSRTRSSALPVPMS